MKKISIIIFITLVFGALLVGCNKKNVISGMFVNTADEVKTQYIFDEDGNCRIIRLENNDLKEEKGDYFVDGDNITIVVGDRAAKYNYSLNDDMLILYQDDLSLGTVYAKTEEEIETDAMVIEINETTTLDNIISKELDEDTKAEDALESANEKDINSVIPSVVKIYCSNALAQDEATGSGFFLYNDKTVVTNYHVIKDAYTVTVKTEAGKVYFAKKVLAYSEPKDIAILEIEEKANIEPLIVGNPNETNTGDHIYAIGSPLGIQNTVSDGIVSGRIEMPDMDDIEVIQITAPISPGSSGGALLNDDLEAIGVTSASYVNGQNLNLAIPITYVEELYNNRGEPKEFKEFHEQEKTVNTVTLYDLCGDAFPLNGQDVTIEAYYSSGKINDPEGHFGKPIYVYAEPELVTGDESYDDQERSDFSVDAFGPLMVKTRGCEFEEVDYKAGQKIYIDGIIQWYPETGAVLMNAKKIYFE